MKALLVALFVGLSSLAHASPSRDRALELFAASPAVEKAKPHGPGLEAKAPEAVLLGADCGFVGCTERYLVAQAYLPLHHAPSRNVLAVVTLPTRGSHAP